MANTSFIYVTYISAPPQKIWRALIDPELTSKYWQHVNVSDWKPGSKWEHRRTGKNKNLDLIGKVVEVKPPRRMVWTWAFPSDENKAGKYSRVTYDIEPTRGVTRLSVTHDRLDPGSDMLEGITDGWPKVLSSLKTLLETKRPLPRLW